MGWQQDLGESLLFFSCTVNKHWKNEPREIHHFRNFFSPICRSAMQAVGLHLLSPDILFPAFKDAGVASSIGCARINASRFMQVNTAKGPWSFLDEIRSAAVSKVKEGVISHSVAVEGADSGMQKASLPIVAQQTHSTSMDEVRVLVREAVLEVLGDAQVLDASGQFPAGAFDSLSAVDLSNKLSDLAGLSLPGTLVFDYPSVPALSGYVYSKMVTKYGGETLANSEIGPAIQPLLTLPSYPEHTRALMHIHPAARMPIPPAYLNSDDTVSIVPFARWDLESLVGPTPSKAPLKVRFGSWLRDVEQFDAVLFTVTSNEAYVMDPQQRLLLETSWEAIQTMPNGAMDSTTGVYIGIQQMEYGAVAAAHNPIMGAFSATSTAFSVASGRLSFTYGLTGPAVSIDTACSSAIVAAHNAAQHAGRNRCTALTAGVNLMLSERTTAAAQIAGMLTADGRCKTLDAAADGYVRAEACIALVLRPMEVEGASVMEETMVWVHSSFVNQDGRSSSLTAPNGPAQQRVLRGALEAAGSAPNDVFGLEMHGTGTALGDPIEMGAATAVLPGLNGLPLRLSAAKSRVGHAEPGAGSVGMYNAITQLVSCSTNAILHLKSLNSYVRGIYMELESNGQHRVPPTSARQDGPSVQSRSSSGNASSLLGVSSFAFQGTNAHLILGTDPTAQPDQSADCRIAPYVHQRHWYCGPLYQMIDHVHAITSSRVAFHTQLQIPARLAYVMDHRVRGRTLFPAAGMLEVASASARTTLETSLEAEIVSLSGVGVISPLVLHVDGSVLALVCTVDARSGSLTLASSGPTKLEHLRTNLERSVHMNKPRRPALSLQQRMFEAFITEARKVVNAAIPEVQRAALAASNAPILPTGQLSLHTILHQGQQPSGYVMHPALLDATTHLAASVQLPSQAEPGITRVPVAVSNFVMESIDLWEMGYVQCVGAFEGLASDGSTVSSFKTAHLMHLVGFQTKLIRAAPLSNAHRSSIIIQHSLPVDQGEVSVATPAERTVTTQQILQKMVEKLLNVDVKLDQPLMEAGMDSLAAVELRTALVNEFGLDLPATITFDFPTVHALASFIDEEKVLSGSEVCGTEHSRETISQSIPSESAPRAVADPSALQEMVAKAVSKILGTQVPVNMPFMEAGLDSLGAVELRSALAITLGANLPATITFDYPTIQALAGYFNTNLEAVQGEQPVSEQVTHSSLERSMSPSLMSNTLLKAPMERPAGVGVSGVVAVGMASRYPSHGGIDCINEGIEAFALTIQSGVDLPRRIPLQVRCVDSSNLLMISTVQLSTNTSFYCRDGISTISTPRMHLHHSLCTFVLESFSMMSMHLIQWRSD